MFVHTKQRYFFPETARTTIPAAFIPNLITKHCNSSFRDIYAHACAHIRVSTMHVRKLRQEGQTELRGGGVGEEERKKEEVENREKKRKEKKRGGGAQKKSYLEEPCIYSKAFQSVCTSSSLQ